MEKLDPQFVEMAALVADDVYRKLLKRTPIISPWLNPAEAAKYLGLQERGLEAYRRCGGGPEYVRPTKKTVRYHVKDLDTWLQRDFPG